MNPNLHQGSAKIYQFPVGGRSGLPIRHPDNSSLTATPRVSEVACSDSWYHEAAIEDARKPGEH